MAVRVSVLGASGYTGGELVRLLTGHPQVQLAHLTASHHEGRAMGAVFPNLRGMVDLTLEPAELARVGRDSDVVFVALPHGMALQVVPELLSAGTRVVDLGADFRLKDPAAYARWYKQEHTAPGLLDEAVYGLTELYRPRVRGARLVANPGCYPTAALLALAPLAQAGLIGGPVVVDAKSGVSGAGRSPSAATHFGEVNENTKPYNVGVHRHQPEIEQALAEAGSAVRVLFAPHLVPMTRGILATCYAPLARPVSADAALDLYREAYAGEPFVRVLDDDLPQTKATYGSNFCDVAVRVDAERGLAVAVAALDNLVKGAAGQAVQNMNVMCGLPETAGLWAPALFP
ncbi:MAG: N-acetyl-gamma-glutamyl-phosphate reductase [Armatimonadota bacterium]|nr:N-acetyl-gamma-glutamyl-phosphate reductase [Armatimonadota bacterium]MDW8155220.1 N-acetyl-gamma-glutamyl-phosphate reductase [Armatimonadota bacterium]